MINLINITQARNNLSSLIKDVYLQKKTYILIRDSLPQAVISPFEDYQTQDAVWEKEVELLMAKGKKVFAQWLKQAKLKAPKKEADVYKIIDKASGRN